MRQDNHKEVSTILGHTATAGKPVAAPRAPAPMPPEPDAAIANAAAGIKAALDQINAQDAQAVEDPVATVQAQLHAALRTIAPAVKDVQTRYRALLPQLHGVLALESRRTSRDDAQRLLRQAVTLAKAILSAINDNHVKALRDKIDALTSELVGHGWAAEYRKEITTLAGLEKDIQGKLGEDKDHGLQYVIAALPPLMPTLKSVASLSTPPGVTSEPLQPFAVTGERA